MQKLFGVSKKPVAPPMDLNETSTMIDKRVGHIEAQISKADQELLQIKAQLQSTKMPSTQNSLKQKALVILKRKKMYEQQRDSMMGTQMNLDQLTFMREQAQTTKVTVDAMKASTTEMKKQMKTMNLNDIERTMESMQDLMFDQNELQEIMSRSYDLCSINDSELDAEFAALQEEVSMEQANPQSTKDQVPSYIPSLPSVPEAGPSSKDKVAMQDFTL